MSRPARGYTLAGDPEGRAFPFADVFAAQRAGGDDTSIVAAVLRLRWPTVKEWHLPPAGRGRRELGHARSADPGGRPVGHA